MRSLHLDPTAENRSSLQQMTMNNKKKMKKKMMIVMMMIGGILEVMAYFLR